MSILFSKVFVKFVTIQISYIKVRQISSELLYLFKIEPTMETPKEVFRGSSIFSKYKTPAFG